MRTRHGIAWLSFLCASILLPGAAWPMDASCASAPQQLDDWETASPEDVGLDAAVLCKITQELATQGRTAARPNRRNVHAVLVARHGRRASIRQRCPGKVVPVGVGLLTIGSNTLDAHQWQIGRTMGDGRLAVKTTRLETGQVIAEDEPGEHLADHDMGLRLHQRQIIERAGIDR